MELEKGLVWGPEVAAANLPPGRTGGKLTCLPLGAGVCSPAGGGGAGGPGGGDLARGEGVTGGDGDGGGDCDVPPGAGEDPVFAAAATDRL